jgi:hypothetical protein|tara:strand:- start:8 stop:217 length:210 start_codon:yes stop_codon:yes gene_type:complete
MPRKISQRSKKVSKKKLSKRLRTMKRNSKRMSRKSLRGGTGCGIPRKSKQNSKGGSPMGYLGQRMLYPK